MPKKKPWTDQETALAKGLFGDAIATGTPKPARPLAVTGFLSGGPTRTVWSKPDWRRYLPDARKMIEDDPAND